MTTTKAEGPPRTLNAQQKDELRSAIEHALEDASSLERVATLLRLDQLMGETLHPDDSCGWSAMGSSEYMGQLGMVLDRLGLERKVDLEARRLFAELRLARVTLKEIEYCDSEWGGAIATAQSWRGAKPMEVKA